MSKVFLRKAVYDDIDMLFKWANDPVVRSNSFNEDPIPYKNHEKWFSKMMEDTAIFQYILMSDDIPVGQIRLNVQGQVAEIGYSIDQAFRGYGYGHIILQLAAEVLREKYPEINRVVAKVKPENTSSNRLFISEGYKMKYNCYELELKGR